MLRRLHKSRVAIRGVWEWNPSAKICQEFMSEQTSIEAKKNEPKFQWCAHSRLDGNYLRPMKEIRIDKDTYLDYRIQRELDEEAVNLVANQTYAGGTRIVLDPSLISDVMESKPIDLNGHENI